MSSRLNDVATIIMATAAVGLVALTVARRGSSEPDPSAPLPPLPEGAWEELKATGEWMGDKQAKLVIVEFSDFECPFCARFELDVLAPLRAEFPNDVAVVFHHWPLPNHPNAYPAAIAAECAKEQGRFESYQHLIFQNQARLGSSPYRQIAVDAGVPDTVAFQTCIADQATNPVIDGGAARAKEYGNGGTPSVIVNGERYSGGGPSLTELKAMLASKE